MFFILVFIDDQAISLITENKRSLLAALDVFWRLITAQENISSGIISTTSAAKPIFKILTYQYLSSISPVKCLNSSTRVYFYSAQCLCCTVSTQINGSGTLLVFGFMLCVVFWVYEKLWELNTSLHNQSIPLEENKEANKFRYNLKRIKY